MNGQLELGQKLRGVDVRRVASSVIRSHFLPDLRGNLNAFARQKVRCLKCGHSYRGCRFLASVYKQQKQIMLALAQTMGIKQVSEG